MLEAIILALVLSPVEPPLPEHVPEQVFATLRSVAEALELVGPDEHWRQSFAAEVRYVRQHWRELRYAPGLADAALLPPPAATGQECLGNLCYREHIDARRLFATCHAEGYREYAAEAAQLYGLWNAVRDAGDKSNPWVRRRQALAQLRDMLGPEDFYAGRLPPAAPLWRFEVIDP